MFDLAPPPRRRRPSLTPMIDVVFLLLVFFMLAARFGVEGAISITAGGEGAAGYEGPPRLVELTTGGITLNGRPLPADALPDALARLTLDPGDTIIIRPGPQVPVQGLANILALLSRAGFTGLAVIP